MERQPNREEDGTLIYLGHTIEESSDSSALPQGEPTCDSTELRADAKGISEGVSNSYANSDQFPGPISEDPTAW